MLSFPLYPESVILAAAIGAKPFPVLQHQPAFAGLFPAAIAQTAACHLGPQGQGDTGLPHQKQLFRRFALVIGKGFLPAHGTGTGPERKAHRPATCPVIKRKSLLPRDVKQQIPLPHAASQQHLDGVYTAGIIFCNIRDADYIARKMDINSYMLFSPIFFAGIGLKTQFDNMTWSLLWFCILFVAVALVCKVIGCGLMAKACHFSGGDSLKIGVGMMTRGEVALIVSQKGLAIGLIPAEYFAAVIMLIIVSSVVTPILLKLLYKRSQKGGDVSDEELPDSQAPQTVSP